MKPLPDNLIAHLDELRRRLIIIAAAFLLASILSWFFSRQILDFLTVPLRQFTRESLFFQKPYEAFVIHLQASALSGLFFSSPLFFLQAWMFMAPGLLPREKKFLAPVIVSSIVLFMVGAWFAYAIAIPVGLQFLLSYQTESLKPLLNAASYFSFLSSMILGFGLFFDFPVVLVGLVALGIVKVSTLARFRKIIIVLIVIIAAVITPSPDPLSQLMLALPLWILFEFSLLIARLAEKKEPDSL